MIQPAPRLHYTVIIHHYTVTGFDMFCAFRQLLIFRSVSGRVCVSSSYARPPSGAPAASGRSSGAPAASGRSHGGIRRPGAGVTSPAPIRPKTKKATQPKSSIHPLIFGQSSNYPLTRQLVRDIIESRSGGARTEESRSREVRTELIKHEPDQTGGGQSIWQGGAGKLFGSQSK